MFWGYISIDAMKRVADDNLNIEQNLMPNFIGQYLNNPDIFTNVNSPLYIPKEIGNVIAQIAIKNSNLLAWLEQQISCVSKTLLNDSKFKEAILNKQADRVATFDVDDFVKIWDANSGQLAFTLMANLPKSFLRTIVKTILFNNQGDKLLTVFKHGGVKIWDVYTASCLQGIKGYNNCRLTAAAFCCNDQKLAVGYTDGNIGILNANTGEILKIFKGHNNDIISLVTNVDGDKIATGSFDNTVKIWDANSGKLLHTLNVSNASITNLEFNKFGDKLLSYFECGENIQVWNIHTAKLIKTIKASMYFIGAKFYNNNEIMVFDSYKFFTNYNLNTDEVFKNKKLNDFEHLLYKAQNNKSLCIEADKITIKDVSIIKYLENSLTLEQILLLYCIYETEIINKIKYAREYLPSIKLNSATVINAEIEDKVYFDFNKYPHLKKVYGSFSEIIKEALEKYVKNAN